ncbi:MAG TPA: TerD family protein [Rhodospirillales bacterium]|nr:TerD family protein [Rhodospirillales bacterium]
MQLLQKGQSIRLKSKSGAQLTKIAVGLGWGKKRKKAFFGRIKEIGVDLDASCVLYDGDKAVIDTVWFGNLRSSDGSVQHTGDDRVGGGGEGEPNEVIKVDLPSLPSQVKSIVFVVNSYSGETFEGVPFAFCNVVDLSSGSVEVARYNLQTDGGSHKGFIIAKLRRDGNSWSFAAIGERSTGRQQTVQDIEPQARAFA